MKPLLYESHLHTPLCRHATGEPEEYAEVAHERGLRGIIVTCHNPLPDGLAQGSRMYPHQWHEYLGIVERAAEEWQGRVDVRLGLEADYWPGLESFLEEQLQSENFNHVLGSVHPHVGDYRKKFFRGDLREYQKLYFEHLAMAAETGLFDTLSHPDLIKNITTEVWKLDELMPDIRRTLDRIAAAGTAMELNTSGRFKSVEEMNPGYEILCEMRERSIPVVLGADAHVPQRVADGYEEALSTLERAGYSEISFFLERRRQTVSIADARAGLRQIS